MNNALNLLSQLRKNDPLEASASKTRLQALAWARVSTETQEERGLSIPEQLREIRLHAVSHGITILAEYHEAASAFQHQSRRIEFAKMLGRPTLIAR